PPVCFSLLVSRSAHHPDPHSFPTRRSSDLLALTLSPFLSYSNNYIYLNPTPTYYQGLQVFQYTQNSVLRRGGELMLSYYISSSLDRKSTRLNSSHVSISYAVFCLKKKTNTE